MDDLASVDVDASLAELAPARGRTYYDAEADAAAAEAH